jgi:hypothetical protein
MMSEGILPLNILYSRERTCGFVNAPMLKGMVLLRLFPQKYADVRDVANPIVEGMDQLTMFELRSRYCNIVNALMLEGMVLLRLFSPK